MDGFVFMIVRCHLQSANALLYLILSNVSGVLGGLAANDFCAWL